MTELLNGKKVAEHLRKETVRRVRNLKERAIFPKMVIVRVGDDSASVSYERSAMREMEKNEIQAEKETFPEDVSLNDVLESIQKWNVDDSCHGILVMQPLPMHLSIAEVAKTIDPEKDIDGMSLVNLGGLMQEEGDGFEPSTPQAVMELLSFYDISLKGKEVTIVGSSTVVGLPLSVLLTSKFATVTTCHIYTRNLKKHTQSADILISATGVTGLITADSVKEGAVVIDVGYGEVVNGSICGDVQFDEVKEKASFITPVPGGVGAITSVVLASHVVDVAEKISMRG